MAQTGEEEDHSRGNLEGEKGGARLEKRRRILRPVWSEIGFGKRKEAGKSLMRSS